MTQTEIACPTCGGAERTTGPMVGMPPGASSSRAAGFLVTWPAFR